METTLPEIIVILEKLSGGEWRDGSELDKEGGAWKSKQFLLALAHTRMLECCATLRWLLLLIHSCLASWRKCSDYSLTPVIVLSHYLALCVNSQPFRSIHNCIGVFVDEWAVISLHLNLYVSFSIPWTLSVSFFCHFQSLLLKLNSSKNKWQRGLTS